MAWVSVNSKGGVLHYVNLDNVTTLSEIQNGEYLIQFVGGQKIDVSKIEEWEQLLALVNPDLGEGRGVTLLIAPRAARATRFCCAGQDEQQSARRSQFRVVQQETYLERYKFSPVLPRLRSHWFPGAHAELADDRVCSRRLARATLQQAPVRRMQNDLPPAT